MQRYAKLVDSQRPISFLTFDRPLTKKQPSICAQTKGY
nr:MAG TPA: hypothetical protein [Caudoviricetes sp.]